MAQDDATFRDQGGKLGDPAHVCPSCGALLYSHRARLCGSCGALLPPEFVVSDAEVEAQQNERQWARDLANKFDAAARDRNIDANIGRARISPAETPDLEELEARVQRMSCASAFKYRKRLTWVYITGFVVTLLPEIALIFLAAGYFHFNREAWLAYLALAGFNALTWFGLWRNAMPICPNCHQNIRLCPAEFCLRCGKPLNHQRCTDCGVDNSWIGWLHPGRNGAYGRIHFCPGCGVELDTWLRRWQAGD